MHPIFQEMIRTFEFTNDLKTDIMRFLIAHDCPKTAEHCREVGVEARRIAIRYQADPVAAEIAGWLHDISAVIPNSKRIEVAKELDLEILPEEESFPMIIHQKLSRAIAEGIFQIEDRAILSAIECHTTLKSNATLLDQVLFVADKIAWDQPGEPPYLQEVTKNLEHSITHAAFSYIRYLWERKENLRVIHPWLRDAYEEMNSALNEDPCRRLS